MRTYFHNCAFSIFERDLHSLYCVLRYIPLLYIFAVLMHFIVTQHQLTLYFYISKVFSYTYWPLRNVPLLMGLDPQSGTYIY